MSSLALPPGSLDSFLSLVLGGRLLSALGPRGELLCWALTARPSCWLGGRLSLTGWERRLAGRGEGLQTQEQLRPVLLTGLLTRARPRDYLSSTWMGLASAGCWRLGAAGSGPSWKFSRVDMMSWTCAFSSLISCHS